MNNELTSTQKTRKFEAAWEGYIEALKSADAAGMKTNVMVRSRAANVVRVCSELGIDAPKEVRS